jgi:hypothetical protein
MTLQKVCLPPSIVYSVQGPFPFEVDQTPRADRVRYEYFDQIRLIFMDGRGHPPAGRAAHEDGPFDRPLGRRRAGDRHHPHRASTITNNGLDHSDQIHMVERYKLSPDGKR